MKSKTIRLIAIEDVQEELEFCTWLKRELNQGNTGIDIDHGNLSEVETRSLLKKIRQREQNFGKADKRIFTRHTEESAQ